MYIITMDKECDCGEKEVMYAMLSGWTDKFSTDCFYPSVGVAEAVIREFISYDTLPNEFIFESLCVKKITAEVERRIDLFEFDHETDEIQRFVYNLRQKSAANGGEE